MKRPLIRSTSKARDMTLCSFSGESKSPDAVAEAILKRSRKISEKEGISEDRLSSELKNLFTAEMFPP